MTGANADRARRVGAELGKDCTESIAQPVDLDEAVADLVVGQDAGIWPVFSAGYGAGYAAGHRAGYVEGIQVLDEAGAMLAAANPVDAIEAAAARRRRTEYATPPRTAEQIRAQAEYSWRRAERAEQQGRRAG